MGSCTCTSHGTWPNGEVPLPSAQLQALWHENDKGSAMMLVQSERQSLAEQFNSPAGPHFCSSFKIDGVGVSCWQASLHSTCAQSWQMGLCAADFEFDRHGSCHMGPSHYIPALHSLMLTHSVPTATLVYSCLICMTPHCVPLGFPYLYTNKLLKIPCT